jgi:CofD-related protein of GAK system
MISIDDKRELLFFTGGTALRQIAREISTQKNLIMLNIITVFDSGGSTSEIRKEFDIIAIGDIRNRIISLMNNKNVSEVLKYRFDKGENNKLQIELDNFIDLSHPIINKINKKHQIFFSNSLKIFNKEKSSDFNLQNGSIGNFIILGEYLKHKNIYKTIKTIKNLLELKDEIMPITNKSIHLGAILENQELIIGQHKLTEKESPKLKSNIKEIFLTSSRTDKLEVSVNISPDLKKKIEHTDLIIYPIGSFYTSILSNFLIKGVNKSIEKNKNPKVYIPNTFFDPELNNRSLSFQVNEIFKYLDAKTPEDYLNYILIDKNHKYPFSLDIKNIPSSIKIIKKDIIDNNNDPKLSATKTVQELKELIH